ncbi:hypothetical protein [Nonomuraea sp. NPDC005501]|uniref:hypothetical protein n=1 Tax=Nonomuraea sp. NPDC005501 TaxID=3156884 RepID=UPI0033A56ACD
MRSLIAAGGPLIAAFALAGAVAGPAAAATHGDDGIGLECSASSRTTSTWVYSVNDEVVSGSYSSERCKDPAIGWRPYWWENIQTETDNAAAFDDADGAALYENDNADELQD